LIGEARGTWTLSDITWERSTMQRRHRLTRSKQFQEVRRRGRSWSHPLLVVLALGNNLAYSRFGFLVSKHIGKAVMRNRVKRWMREAVRSRLACVSPGWDVVVIARAPIARADLRMITEALDSLLHQAGLVAPPPKAPDAAK
jgi:ribonuclease P protein component